MRKHDQILSLIKRWNVCYLKWTHKFGIKLPKTMAEALKIDQKTGMTFWADAIAKEMKDIKFTFQILPDGQSAPIGYQKIPCHMVFDIKIEDFRQKARLVTGDHKTEAPTTMMYATIVSHAMVCLALTIAALNDLR